MQSTQFGNLHDEDKTIWLQQVLQNFEHANPDELTVLQQRYETYKDTKIQQATRQNKILWLKILARLPEMSQMHALLAENLLDELFDQEVFYLWFEKQIKSDNPLQEKKNAEELWTKTKQIFYKFKFWFETNTLYHHLGFLLINDDKSMSKLKKIIENSGKPVLRCFCRCHNNSS